FDSLASSIDKAIHPSKQLTDDLTGLRDALISDNRSRIAKDVVELGESAQRTGGQPISEFNRAILTAIEIQERAEGAFSDTNGAIDAQAFSLGEASRAWIADALKTQEDLKDIIDGSDWWETLTETIFQPGSADEFISRDRFKALILGGRLDLNEISQIAVTQGKDAANAAYDAWMEGAQLSDAERGDAQIFKSTVLPDILNSVVDAYEEAAVQAALTGSAIDETSGIAVASASDF